MVMDPGIIASGMISDKIQEEGHFPRMQSFVDAVERIPSSDARVWNILHDGIRRTDYVCWRPAGESAPESGEICGIFEGDASGDWASLPNSHEPDGVESELSQGVPFGVRHIGKIDIAAKPVGKLFEPSPGVYFVKVWLRAK